MLLLLGVLASWRTVLGRSVVDDCALEEEITLCDKRPKLNCGADFGKGGAVAASARIEGRRSPVGVGVFDESAIFPDRYEPNYDYEM